MLSFQRYWDEYGADFSGPVPTDGDYESVTVEVPQAQVLSEEEKRSLLHTPCEQQNCIHDVN